MSASYVIDVIVACLFLLLASRTSDLTCVACLFRLMFLRTSYVICVACLFRLMVLRTSYVTCVPCLFLIRDQLLGVTHFRKMRSLLSVSFNAVKRGEV